MKKLLAALMGLWIACLSLPARVQTPEYTAMTLVSAAEKAWLLGREETERDPAVRQRILERRQEKRRLKQTSRLTAGLLSLQDLFYELTFEVDPQVAADVEKRRQDPDVLATVEADALDPDIWWQWFDLLPVDHEVYLSQRGVLDWMEVYMGLSSYEKSLLNYNLMWITQDSVDALIDPDYSPPPVWDMPEFRYD